MGASCGAALWGLWEAGRNQKGMGRETMLPLAAESGGGPKVDQWHSLLPDGCPARVHFRLQTSFSCLMHLSKGRAVSWEEEGTNAD